MRKFLLMAAVAAIGLVGVHNANAQLKMNPTSANEPLTGLSPEQWVYLAEHLVNGKPVIGKPLVYMVNASGEELASVVCDRWVLVGNKPYIEGNPASLPAWQVTLVGTEGFDGYCKDGVTAQTATGNIYKGTLNSPDHTFGNATFIIFRTPS